MTAELSISEDEFAEGELPPDVGTSLAWSWAARFEKLARKSLDEETLGALRELAEDASEIRSEAREALIESLTVLSHHSAEAAGWSRWMSWKQR